ncbi:FAD-binding oxidoreductase [Actinoplanes sichuanensis]|uniref:FAD-binding protein n=1 Tax=Actinoplanes sichuanensis TaxID=512349 RepID=A0ABW4AUV6_9ACTN|nr:FAD-binding oxidoreductase [Actinoplanes sichuanensis]BEL07179.1 FAD-binding oxidoreductase [Actinoplanes sichuanensis]
MLLSRRGLFRAGLVGLAAPKTGWPAGPKVIRPGPEPTPADWQALADGVQGSLELPGDAGYDEARRLFSPRFDAVLPPAVLRCAGPADVVEGVRFAARMGLPIVPRCGGHSYVGASTTAVGLVLDVRPMRTVEFDAPTRTATIGGGAPLIDVYTGLGVHGVSVPAGTCGSVGISGLTSGGGIGVAASAYGLTCDNVVAADVVTADGNSRTVDAEREPELFWGLCGGGGGRFGVVTSWRIRTYPAGTTSTFQLTYPWTDAAAVAAGWQARNVVAPDDCWSACQFVSDATGTPSVRIGGYVLDGDAGAEAAALVEAIGREPATTAVESKPHVRLLQDRAAGAARGTHVIGSEIFTGTVPPAGVDALIAVVQARAATRRPGLAKLKRMTGAPARVRADTNAFPWHGASTMLQWLVDLPAADPAAVADGYTWIDSGHRAVAPWSSGRYVNYLEPGPVDPSRYHGTHLDRLRRLQASVDPDGLFRTTYTL